MLPISIHGYNDIRTQLIGSNNPGFGCRSFAAIYLMSKGNNTIQGSSRFKCCISTAVINDNNLIVTSNLYFANDISNHLSFVISWYNNVHYISIHLVKSDHFIGFSGFLLKRFLPPTVPE